MALNEIARACALLSSGEVIGLPTETVYGLGADACHGEAVAKIYALKNRPTFNPLILHVSSLPMAQNFGVFNEVALKLAKYFWQENKKPLTLVTHKVKNSGLSELATAGLETMAIRLPNHPVALELIENYGSPLVAPSANPSNRLSTTTRDQVLSYFSDLYVLEGGKCQVGLESTIIDVTGNKPVILRHGGTPLEEISQFLGWNLAVDAGEKIKAPGQLQTHYAPKTPLYMNAVNIQEGGCLLGFGNTPGETLNLSPEGDLIEAASNLFESLHKLDGMGFKSIHVVPIPEKGLGRAINDRLKRAAWGN